MAWLTQRPEMESLLVDSLKRTGSEAMWLTPRQKEQESLPSGRSSAEKALKNGKTAEIIAIKTQ